MEHSRNQHFLFCRLPQIHNVYLRTINDCMFLQGIQHWPWKEETVGPVLTCCFLAVSGNIFQPARKSFWCPRLAMILVILGI